MRCPTRASPRLARSGLRSPRWRLASLLLEARPDLIRGGLDVGGEDEHHVEKVGELADRSLATLATQRSGGFVRFLDELRRDRIRSGFEQLRGVRVRGP